MNLPELLTINAFDGDVVPSGGLAPSGAGAKWALRNPPMDTRRFLKPETLPDLKNWKDSRVGWGLIAAETPGASQSDLIANADLPQCLRDLLKDRDDAPVFRYRATWEHRFRLLRNWRDDKNVDTNSSPFGTAPGSLPSFLMIWGNPEQVPWALQYQLGASGRRYVGRLPLEGVELDNYVKALRSDWVGNNCDVHSPLIWATDYPNIVPPDITPLMRAAVAEPLYQDFKKDVDLKPQFLAGTGQASHAGLTGALKANRPGLIVTTSHGYTGPSNDTAQMKLDIGLLVDQQRTLMDVEDLLKDWKPDGAIWYSHACCSAGSDSLSTFHGLLDPASAIDKTLTRVASLGARVSRLAVRLLGSDKPARAFIGHVEPTFSWTLEQPETKQLLTTSLITALYNEMFLGSPCGYALGGWYARYASYSTAYQNYQSEYDGSSPIQAQMLYQRLVAQDIQSLVVLGDPTVALPSL
jgi:hypothetical protein